MALFNGQNIFGGAVRLVRSNSERAGQRNTYPALDGKEYLDMGSRGRFTAATGRFVCANAAALNTAFLLFESYWDGNAYVLTDQFGNAWPSVLLVEFTPVGDLNIISPTGKFTQRYAAKFEHLI